MSKTPHQDIIPVYERLLKLLDKFPANYTYRAETEKLVKHRLDIVKNVRVMCTIVVTIIISMLCDKVRYFIEHQCTNYRGKNRLWTV